MTKNLHSYIDICILQELWHRNKAGAGAEEEEILWRC